MINCNKIITFLRWSHGNCYGIMHQKIRTKRSQSLLSFSSSLFSASLNSFIILHQSGSIFLVQQLTDQLCRVEPCQEPFSFSDWDLDCLLAMSLSWCLSWRKVWTLFILWRDASSSSYKMSITKPSMDCWNEQSAQMSESISTPPAEVMAAISPGPLPDISPISSMMVEMCWFSSASHLSVFHWTKLKFQHRLLGNSSLSLSSIQPSTVHGCFSSADCNLLFFS